MALSIMVGSTFLIALNAHVLNCSNVSQVIFS